MSSEFIFSWVLKVHSLHPPLTNHIKLIAKVSAAAALLAVATAGSGQKAEAQSLSTNQVITIQGGATYGLEYGESFNVSSPQITQKGSVFRPFETTVGTPIALGGARTQGADPVSIGNVGQATLTLTFDRDGFLPIQACPDDADCTPNAPTFSNLGNLENVVGDGSITALAGITPLGGDQLAGGTLTTNLPSNIRLNQDSDSGLPGIEFVTFESTESAGSSVTQNAASITSTLTGTSAISASVSAQSNIINSLTVFD